MRKNWLVDFDDTLASGPLTWTINLALPRFIRTHQLPADEDKLRATVLDAQMRSNRGEDNIDILRDFFVQMGWSSTLEMALFRDIQENYKPELFEDALPFLDALKTAGQTIYIVSNNPHAPGHIEQLQIGHYIERVFTPKLLDIDQPKPHRNLWNRLIQLEASVQPDNTVIVGDDPWSDGEFADNCGLSCWIVDRLARYNSLHSTRSYRWVNSLREIVID